MPAPEKLICVVGPTACGKTTLGVQIAKRYNGEVVSIDSMQIYRGMTIGTAAPTEAETEGVPHHMVGDPLRLRLRGGGGADGHPPVDLHRVDADHLAVVPFRDLNAQGGFAAGRGAHNTNEFFRGRHGSPFCSAPPRGARLHSSFR